MLFHTLEVSSLAVDPYIPKLPVAVFSCWSNMARGLCKWYYPENPTQECQNTNKTSRTCWRCFLGRNNNSKQLSTHESEVILLNLMCQQNHLDNLLHVTWHHVCFTGEHISHVWTWSIWKQNVRALWFFKFIGGLLFKMVSCREKTITCVNLMLNVKIISYQSFPAPTFRVKRLNVNI